MEQIKQLQLLEKEVNECKQLSEAREKAAPRDAMREKVVEEMRELSSRLEVIILMHIEIIRF